MAAPPGPEDIDGEPRDPKYVWLIVVFFVLVLTFAVLMEFIVY